jgi:hypothetical protein
VTLPPGRSITLLNARVDEIAALDPARLASLGVTVLWRSGQNAIVSSDGLLPDDAELIALHRQALRETPLQRAFAAGATGAASPLPGTTLATSFAPVIQEMVDQVAPSEFMQWIRNLSGALIQIGGISMNLPTRSTQTIGCDRAEQYTRERLLAMGYTDVQYDPFSFSGVNARNVVATLPGVTRPGRIVLVGGHLDSISPMSGSDAPGANDNASGVAALLIAAKILRQYSFESTIKIVAFTGEEQGLHGSRHYANAAAARGDSIVGAVLMDMIGWKNALNQIDIEGETAWLPLMNVMSDAVARYTTIAGVQRFVSFGSDHVPFQDVGYPAFLAIETEYDDYPCYHQTCDTTSWNQPEFGAETIRAVLATVAHLAGPRGFYVAHSPLTSTDATAGPYDVVATFQQLAALQPDSLLLHWRADGGAEQVATLTPTGNPSEYHATIPGQPAGTLVRYWISARDVDGRLAVHPVGAPGTVHYFEVAPRATIFSEDFESGAPGWTHGGPFDDWQIGAPAGLAEDPAAAYAGSMIAGTDLSGLGSSLGRYESNCNSWLESPPIDCSNASAVRLSFQRKLAVERSNGGAWDVARVQVNGTTVWENPSSPNQLDPGWTPQDLDISALADGQPAVRVRYTLKANGSTGFGGWNIDEFRLTGQLWTTVSVDDVARPAFPVLLANLPNPGSSTLLRFDLPARANVDLAIYDTQGRRIRTMWRGTREAGRNELRWDGRGADGRPSPTGVYFCRLAVGGIIESRKLILMR